MIIFVLILLIWTIILYWPYISAWFRYRGKNYKIIISGYEILVYEIRDISPPELIPGTRILFRISAEDLPGIIKDVSDDGIYYSVWSGPIVYNRVTKKMIKGILHEKEIIGEN